MSSTNKTKGTCNFCGRKLTSGGLIRHLKSCDEREEAVARANEQNKKAPEQRLYHLQLKNEYSSDFWLHLEVNGNARLKQLDAYLRNIWLECCGHLSRFAIGNNVWEEELSMNQKIYQLLDIDMELTHVYDYGSSTYTTIKTVDARWGKPLTRFPIFLMARNELPKVECDRCPKTARWLYDDFNSYEEQELLCNDHKEEVATDEYDERLLKLVNSPRFGVCGYTGPATNPYKGAEIIGKAT